MNNRFEYDCLAFEIIIAARVFLVWHMFATIFKFDEELLPRKDPFLASVRHKSSVVHLRDPYPYEFSYASGPYIFMAEFICWEPQGGQRLITSHRGPLLFLLELLVFGDALYSLWPRIGLSRRPYQHIAYATYAYLAIDLKTDRPLVCGIKHEEKIFIISRYTTIW